MTKEIGGRRKSFLGLSKGNWITLLLATIGIVGSTIGVAITYGASLNQIANNTKKDIEQDKRIERLSDKMDIMKRDIQIQISTSEGRTRSDIKELRTLIIQSLKK